MTWHLHKFSKILLSWSTFGSICNTCVVLLMCFGSITCWMENLWPNLSSWGLRNFFSGVTFTPLSIQYLKFQHTAINNTPAAWSCRYYASLLGWLLSGNEYWLISSKLNIYTWTLIKPETLLLFCVCFGPYVPEEHENTGRAPKYVTVRMSRNDSNYAKRMESSWFSIHPFIHPVCQLWRWPSDSDRFSHPV